MAESAGAVPIVWLDSFIKFSIEGITGRGDIMPSNLFRLNWHATPASARFIFTGHFRH
jgi:hypothetical protein